MEIEGVCVDIARRRQVSYYGKTLLNLLGAVDAPAESSNNPSVYREKGIFLKALKKSTTPQAVNGSLSRFGKIVHIRMPFNIKKKQNIGFAHVFFQDARTAKWLLQVVKEVEVDCKSIKISPFYLTKELKSTPPVRKTSCRESEERPTNCPEGYQLSQMNPKNEGRGRGGLYRSMADEKGTCCLQLPWSVKPTCRRYWENDNRKDKMYRVRCSDSNIKFRLSLPCKSGFMLIQGQTRNITTLYSRDSMPQARDSI